MTCEGGLVGHLAVFDYEDFPIIARVSRHDHHRWRRSMGGGASLCYLTSTETLIAQLSSTSKQVESEKEIRMREFEQEGLLEEDDDHREWEDRYQVV